MGSRIRRTKSSMECNDELMILLWAKQELLEEGQNVLPYATVLFYEGRASGK